jgi:hypothetical protein
MSSPPRPDQAASPPEGLGEKIKTLVARHRSTILWVLAALAGVLLAWFLNYHLARGPDVSGTVVRYEL